MEILSGFFTFCRVLYPQFASSQSAAGAAEGPLHPGARSPPQTPGAVSCIPHRTTCPLILQPSGWTNALCSPKDRQQEPSRPGKPGTPDLYHGSGHSPIAPAPGAPRPQAAPSALAACSTGENPFGDSRVAMQHPHRVGMLCSACWRMLHCPGCCTYPSAGWVSPRSWEDLLKGSGQ